MIDQKDTAFPNLTIDKIKANINLFERKLIPFAEKTRDDLAVQNMKKCIDMWNDELKRRGKSC